MHILLLWWDDVWAAQAADGFPRSQAIATEADSDDYWLYILRKDSRCFAGETLGCWKGRRLMTVHLSPSKDGDQFITTVTVGGDFIQLILDIGLYSFKLYLHVRIYSWSEVTRAVFSYGNQFENGEKRLLLPLLLSTCEFVAPHHPFCFCIQVLFLIPAAPLHAVNS